MSDPLTERRSGSWWRPAISLPPWWVWLLGIATAVGTAVWQLITTSGKRDATLFVGSLAWPGLLIAAVVFLVAWLGWSLDLE